MKKDFQDFAKRLRAHISPKKIRYFHVGEYGEQLRRPHYHALIFGYDFADKTIHSRRNGYDLFRSPSLERLWRAGFSTVGNLTFETASYCAKYCIKKITGQLAPGHYGDLLPEYMTCSKGIGQAWLEKFKVDVYPHDYVVTQGKRRKVPRYYDKQLGEPELKKLKLTRMKNAKPRSLARMAAAEDIAFSRFALTARNLAA